MHRLSHIFIKNFRVCRDVSLPLGGYTPLVGPNNAGKSTILHAIDWVLKPKALANSDFTDEHSPVEIVGCIDGVDTEVLDRIPDPKHRKAIAPYCKEGRLWIRAIASGTGMKAISQEVWDVEKNPAKDFPEHWRTYPTGLPQAVSALLPEPLVVQAMHDLEEDLGKSKAGTTIKDLLDEIMKPVLETHEELNTALDTIRHLLSVDGNNRSKHLQEFDTRATEALSDFFPGLGLDLDLRTVEIKDFFKTGDLHVTDRVTNDRRRFDEMGTGAQRTIQVALIRYLAETRKGNGNRPARRLLLIDEPELYLHPQGVRRMRQALASLSMVGFQVIFSTHSPLMLSRDNVADTIIVSKTSENGVTTRKPLRQAVEEAIEGAESQSRTLFEFGNLAQIYFADSIVLCEGKTDQRLLPLAYERLYNRSPELDHIAFVSLGSCTDIPKALLVLKSMKIKACAVVDLDFAYTHARSAGLLKKDAKDLAEAKACLSEMQIRCGFPLGDNGLPKNDKKAGWTAADVWAEFSVDKSGRAIALRSHAVLKEKAVWAWPQGCIEQITGAVDKGEDAILEQEQELRTMSSSDMQKRMPAFKECFDWIRDLE